MTTEKREGELKRKFGEVMRRHLPGFLVLQYSTNGAPDRSVIGLGRQTNWEFKHATPEFKSPGDQELTCMRLAAAGHCRYVLWHEVGDVMQTIIAHPKSVYRRRSWYDITAETFCVGHDMRWLVEQVERAHR